MTWTRASGNVQVSKWNETTLVFDNVGTAMPVTVGASVRASAWFIGNTSPVGSSIISGIHDVKVTYDAPAGLMRLGDKTTKTGAYGNFVGMYTYNASTTYKDNFCVKVDGVPMQINSATGKDDSAVILASPPAPGEVTLYTTTGAIEFNVAQVGGTVTVEGQALYRSYPEV